MRKTSPDDIGPGTARRRADAVAGGRRTALITGSAVRLGAAIARALAGAGMDIVIHCRTSVAAAGALQRELEAGGVRAWVVRGGLDSEAAVDAVWSAAVQAAGRIDVLVNSAAVFNRDTITSLTGAALLNEFWPNLFAPVLLTRRFALQRIARGNVINLLDRRIAARDPDCVPYLLTKQALAEFTRTAALALAPRIRVNGIAPGPVLPPPGRPMRHLLERAGRIPLRRRVTPREIGGAVRALLDAPSVTGQILFVDGGQHLLGHAVAEDGSD